jgi:metal-dependent amidase/aminoacylase/carboxypeptidase family protein
MINNMTLVRAFGEHVRALGRTPNETDPTAGAGSTDMGDVSHVVPSIHPWLGIVNRGESQIHEHAFARAAISERGDRTCSDAARALAKTAVELMVDGELLKRVRDEHRSSPARPR